MKLVPVFAFLLLISGCSTLLDYTPQQTSWQQREQQLQQFDRWQVEGRIALRTEDDSWSGSLHWQQLSQLYDIRISGPFGQGGISLSGDRYRVVLTTSDGSIIGNQGAEQLMYQQLGWRVPVDSLRYWMVGRPSPDSPTLQVVYDEYGRIQQLQQDDWKIDYKRYMSYQQLELPGKIFITNHHLSVKLVVDHWQQQALISQNP